MAVKQVQIDETKNGMILAKDVYTEDDHFIISKDTKLTSRVIARLKFYGIDVVSVYEEEQRLTLEKSISVNRGFRLDSESEQTYSEQIKATKEFEEFHTSFDASVNVVSDIMSAAVHKNLAINKKELYKEVERILNNTRSGLHMLDMMNCMRDYDDLTYAHSVNVSLLCHAIGEWVGYGGEDLTLLTMSGLLHDIGKLRIPEELVKKPGELTDEEFAQIRKHSIYGYEILKEQKFDVRVRSAALLHHERCDGTGYPGGILSREIDSFAKIVAIADVYDAMTSDRVYRKGICPFDVVEIFEKDGLYKYDPRFLLPFLRKIVESYIGMNVALNDGRKGRVVMINRFTLSRPVVRLKEGFADLSKEQNLRIRSVE